MPKFKFKLVYKFGSSVRRRRAGCSGELTSVTRFVFRAAAQTMALVPLSLCDARAQALFAHVGPARA